jgi:hypothetical protein
MAAFHLHEVGQERVIAESSRKSTLSGVNALSVDAMIKGRKRAV